MIDETFWLLFNKRLPGLFCATPTSCSEQRDQAPHLLVFPAEQISPQVCKATG
jgi:hypothetical protein